MNTRSKLLLTFCCSVSLLWIVYMGILQLYDPFKLNSIKQRRYNPYKEALIANRGNIFDKKGVLLVTSQRNYQIDIDLSAVATMVRSTNRTQSHYYTLIADIISRNINVTFDEIFRKLQTAKGNTVLISETVDENQLLNIRAELEKNKLNIMVSTFSSLRRIYTRGKLAAGLIGVARGVTDTSSRYSRFTYRLEGLNGVEKAFDKDLLGDYGWREIVFDGRQRAVPIPNDANKPVTHGSSVYLTIDSDIQEILENNLRTGLTRYGAKNAIGVILDPRNGDVIAMTGINRDDHKLSDNQLRSNQNMPIQYLFEPGSTMKPFVSLLALEKGLFKEDEVFDCRPRTIKFKNEERTIRDDHAINQATFRDVIVQSSNVGISRIAEKIGRKDLYRHYINLGFGTMTSIDLDYESSGSFKKLNDWTGYTLHSVSFGQEMSVTALQLANAYAALANGGYLLKPNIYRQKVNEAGRVYAQTGRKVIRSIANKKSIAQNNTFLLDVVERGTGTASRMKTIKIAGKTGTSEKVVRGRVSANLRTASFAGFFPYENPEYVMVIVYDEPAASYRFGGSSAAVTFRSIVEQMLSLPDNHIIADSKLKDTHFITMPKLAGLKIADAKKLLAKEKIDYKIYNDMETGYIVGQLPLPGTRFTSKNKVSLYASTEKLPKKEINPNNIDKMPDFVGLTIRQAINIAKLHQVNLKIEGSGYIVSQTVKAGERIRLQQSCLVVAR